jgi:uncharacterized protein (DUF4415 family)
MKRPSSKKACSPEIDPDNPPWTREDFARSVPLSGLPPAIQRALSRFGKRGPQKAPRKVPVSIRLSADVVDGLRATGEGWQVRADEALRAWLASSRPSESELSSQ